jgi:hypothetical protein
MPSSKTLIPFGQPTLLIRTRHHDFSANQAARIAFSNTASIGDAAAYRVISGQWRGAGEGAVC